MGLSLSNVSEEAFREYLESFVKEAFQEDIGAGDHTSLATIPGEQAGRAYLEVKEACYIAGIDLATYIFQTYDEQIQVEKVNKDGVWQDKGEIAFYVEGPFQSILSCERLVLNCIQHLSGITSKAKYLTSLIPDNVDTQLLDTRKTTPHLRMLEKWAVELGGGKNHRMGLYDMIMIKDNHVDFAGSITKAVNRVQEYFTQKGFLLPIVVEARNMEEVREALDTGKADRVLLDNMRPEDMEEAVTFINGRMATEASGGINETNLAEFAKTGVDYISTSALTQGIYPKDLSLKFEAKKG